jgi:hypothetical protein
MVITRAAFSSHSSCAAVSAVSARKGNIGGVEKDKARYPSISHLIHATVVHIHDAACLAIVQIANRHVGPRKLVAAFALHHLDAPHQIPLSNLKCLPHSQHSVTLTTLANLESSGGINMLIVPVK